MQPSLRASNNSDLVFRKKNRNKTKSIFLLNRSAAYLSSFEGINDELSCCSKPGWEGAQGRDAAQAEGTCFLGILPSLYLSSLEFAPRSNWEGSDSRVHVPPPHPPTQPPPPHTHTCTFPEADWSPLGQHGFFLAALGIPIFPLLLRCTPLSSAPGLDILQEGASGPGSFRKGRRYKGRRYTPFLSRKASLASPGLFFYSSQLHYGQDRWGGG